MHRVIAYACFALSGALAGLYGYATGDGQALSVLRAVALAAVAIVGGLSPSWVRGHWQDGKRGSAAFTAIAAAVFFAVTIAASIGGITLSGDTATAVRVKAIAAVEHDRSELARVSAERAALIFKRTDAAAVTAAKDSVASAEQAKDAECKKRGQHCRDREGDVAARRTELAAVMAAKAATDQADKLEVEAATISARIGAAPSISVVDPGAVAVSKLLGIEMDKATSWHVFLIAISLELAGMVANMAPSRDAPRQSKPRHDAPSLVAATAVQPIPLEPRSETLRPDEPRSVEPMSEEPRAVQPSLDGPSSHGDIDAFMLARVTRIRGAQVAWSELFADYCQWCREGSVAPVSPEEFGRHMNDLRHELRLRAVKRDGDVYFVGVGINRLRLVS